jgi:hypothetical protein
MAITGNQLDGKIGQDSNGEAFDSANALNVKGFPEFLARYPDAETFNMADAEDLESRYDSFRTRETVSRELRPVIEDLAKTKWAVGLDDADFVDVEKSLDKLAIENPDALKAMEKTIFDFKTMPEEINALEQQIKNLGGGSEELGRTVEELKNEQATLELSKDAVGLFGLKESYIRVKEIIMEMSKEQRMTQHYKDFFMQRVREIDGRDLNTLKEIKTFLDSAGREELKSEVELYVNGKMEEDNPYEAIAAARDKVEEKYGRNRTTSREIKKISEELRQRLAIVRNNAGEAAQLEVTSAEVRASYDKQKRELLGNISLYGSVSRGIAEKVKKKIAEDQSKAQTLEQLEAVRLQVEQVAQTAKEANTGLGSVNELGDLKSREISIESAMEKKASEIIKVALEKTSIKLGNGLTNIRKAVEDFLQRDTFGVKVGVEAKSKLKEIVIKVAKSLIGADAIAKRLLIKSVLSTF